MRCWFYRSEVKQLPHRMSVTYEKKKKEKKPNITLPFLYNIYQTDFVFFKEIIKRTNSNG